MKMKKKSRNLRLLVLQHEVIIKRNLRRKIPYSEISLNQAEQIWKKGFDLECNADSKSILLSRSNC